MLHVTVLGGAAGGGLPQWNCNCDGCQAAWADPSLQEGQASVAVSADGEHWFLINASPDIRSQIIATPDLHPKALRHSPISGVILTNGEVDAVAGLLSLREGSPFGIYAHERVLSVLDSNAIFNVLSRDKVTRTAVEIDQTFAPTLADGTPSGLTIEPFEVPGKSAWYLEGTDGTYQTDVAGDTLGLRISDGAGAEAFVITATAGVSPALAERLRGASLVMFDGTLWTDDEIVQAGLGPKTGQRMGHISMSGPDGSIQALADLDIGRKVFIHINNSNPAHIPGSPARQALEAAGWDVARTGMRITL